MIKSSIIYGIRIDLQQFLKQVPPFQVEFPIRIEQECSAFLTEVQQFVIKNNRNNICKSFQIQYQRRKYIMELTINFIADLNGKIEFYFGKDLGNAELCDEAKIFEIYMLKPLQMKVIQQIFNRYHQETPKLLLIETLI